VVFAFGVRGDQLHEELDVHRFRGGGVVGWSIPFDDFARKAADRVRAEKCLGVEPAPGRTGKRLRHAANGTTETRTKRYEKVEMDWNRYNQLDSLERSGRLEEALRGFDELESECSDTEDRVLVLLSISNCLGRLKRYLEARHPIEKAGCSRGDAPLS
jgi:hypothetical protein